MHNYEQRAFFKFFAIYFVSVGLLILMAGFFYFKQTKEHILKSEEFSIIEYARHIKMGLNLDKFHDKFSNKIVFLQKDHIHIDNFDIEKNYFQKYIPTKFKHRYMQLRKLKDGYNKRLLHLKITIWSVQILLLLIFAFISYKLAQNAIRPLKESISTLDKFAKDLIHDLNTPVTSIKLNLKLLEKNDDLINKAPFLRLKKSVHSISELHENLTILLQEETFQVQYINLCDVVDDVVQIQKQIFPNITIRVQCQNLKVKVNYKAMKQILNNIVSNGCKYNVENGFVEIYSEENSLYIKDSGNGIKDADKIFQRNYSEQNSSGLGLDIVKRLSISMGINIDVVSSSSGSTFILNFK